MKKYTRNVHRPDGDAKYYNNFIVMKISEKWYPHADGSAHADVIRRELLYKDFDSAVSEYIKQCDRCWQDCNYAEGHHQDTTFVHTIALQGCTGKEDTDDIIPDTFRTATYRYTNEM